MDMLVRGLLDPNSMPLHDSAHGIQGNFQEGLHYDAPPIGAHGPDRSGGQIQRGQIQRGQIQRRGNLVIVVEDHIGLSSQVGSICNYLGLNVEAVASFTDLGAMLDERRPLAVIASFELQHQDGAHVMKAVAVHDRDLPLLMLTGGNPIYLGAAEAMREVLRLTAVNLPEDETSFGQMVEFLARAGQRNRRRRLGPVAEVPVGEVDESLS